MAAAVTTSRSHRHLTLAIAANLCESGLAFQLTAMVDFNIECSKGRVSVSSYSNGLRWPPKPATILRSLLFLPVIAVYILSPIRLSSDRTTWIVAALTLLVISSLLWQGFRSFFPTGESLVCDSTTLTIGRIPNSSFKGQWTYESFPVSTVKQLQFGAVQRGRYGVVTGLLFNADSKRKQILSGLECPEASKILDALASLGVDIVRDPGMPMMVDMALSRRKRWRGLL